MKKTKHSLRVIFETYFGPIFYAVTPIVFSFLLLMIAYSALILTYVQSDGSWPLAIFVSTAITLSVWTFIRYVIYLINKEGGLHSIGIFGVFLWFLLFILSGYSLICFIVTVQYAPNVIAQTVNDVDNAYIALKSAASDMVYGGEYAAFVDRIEGARKSLHSEIFNIVPERQRKDGRITTCGIGEGARTILNNLEKNLPGYKAKRFLEDREHDCSKTDNLNRLESEIFSDIDGQVTKVKDTKFRFKEREKLFEDISLTADEQIAKLTKVQGEIRKSVSRFDFPLIFGANLLLHQAELEYSKLVAQLRALSIQFPQGLQDKVDISSAHHITDHIGILRYLYKHFGANPLTFIAISSFLFDLFIMTLLAFYANRWVVRRRQFKIYNGINDINGTGVRYLLRPRI